MTGPAPHEAAAQVEALADLGVPFAIRTAATLRVADAIAASPDGRLPTASLAEAVGADPDGLDVVLRVLAGAGLLVDDGHGYALTDLGAVLRSDHPADMRARLDLDTALGRADLAFAGLRDGLVAGRPPFEAVFGADYWEVLRTDEPLARSFHREMAKNAGWVAPRLLEVLEITGSPEVVDVGGGSGTMLAHLATARPGVTGTVLDLPLTAPYAAEVLARAAVDDRVRFEGGDFFAHVPPGADLYLVSMVIHDWPDAEAAALLARCREAMGPTSRLVLVDIGPGIHDGPLAEAQVDLHLVACAGARLRRGDELAAMLRAAGLTSVEPLATGGDLEIWLGCLG